MFTDLPLNEPQLGWVVGSADSPDAITMSIRIDNVNEVITIAALHDSGDCVFLRDWGNQGPGTEFAAVDSSAGIDCRGDSGSNAAVVWSDSW